MNVRNILCPVDFSDHSQYALRQAEQLAREYDAELHLIYVEDIGPPGVGYTTERELEKSKHLLESISCDTTDLAIHRKLLLGDPADEICEYASANQIELIVIATHGRTGIKRVVMGSVAEAVVRRAACPVMTVRIPLEVDVLQT